MLKLGSLFSGIGGLELGLERTGGFRTIWQCEIEPYPSAVLKKHWKDVPNLGDITKVNWDGVEKPDVICGGFPCQDISIAGKGKGIREGTRSGLWFEYARAIRAVRPKYVVVENVAEILNRGLDIVLSDLAAIGYDAEWQIISAASVGAIHTRKRMFLLAYPNRVGCNAGKHNGQGNGILQNRERYLEDEETDGNGQPSDASDSFAAITSNPNHAPTENEVCAGRGEFGVPFKSANTNSFRQQRNEPQEVSRFAEFSWCANIRRIEDLRNRPDIPEPLVCGGVNGVPNRMDRIKCLGNAVVPACAQIVGELILEMEK